MKSIFFLSLNLKMQFILLVWQYHFRFLHWDKDKYQKYNQRRSLNLIENVQIKKKKSSNFNANWNYVTIPSMFTFNTKKWVSSLSLLPVSVILYLFLLHSVITTLTAFWISLTLLKKQCPLLNMKHSKLSWLWFIFLPSIFH